MGQLTGRARWIVKKGARHGFAAAAWTCSGLAVRGGSQMRVLTYHRFGNAERDPFSVRLEDFERQMAWLARERLAVSLADLEAFLAARRPLPPDAVLVTIDDGSPSVVSGALPVLQRHAIPSVLFVPAGELRATPDPVDHDGPDARMSRGELVDVARAGVTIGSHGWAHRSFGRMSVAEARDHATRSRAALEDLLGTPVTAFAYPFGTRADYNDATAAVLAEAGYTCAFTSQHGAITSGSDALALPRVKVEGGEGIWMFRSLAHGGLDGWRWIDRTLWRMQAAEG